MCALYCCWRKQKQKILSILKEQTTESPKAGREDNQAAKGAGQYANQRCYEALRKVVWVGSQPVSTRRARHHYTIVIYQDSHACFIKHDWITTAHEHLAGSKMAHKHTETGCLCCRQTQYQENFKENTFRNYRSINIGRLWWLCHSPLSIWCHKKSQIKKTMSTFMFFTKLKKDFSRSRRAVTLAYTRTMLCYSEAAWGEKAPIKQSLSLYFKESSYITGSTHGYSGCLNTVCHIAAS